MPRKHRAIENRQGSRKPCRVKESKPRPRQFSNTKRPRGSATQLAATMTMNICSANNTNWFNTIPNRSTRASLGSSSECPSPRESTYIIQQGKSKITGASISSGSQLGKRILGGKRITNARHLGSPNQFHPFIYFNKEGQSTL